MRRYVRDSEKLVEHLKATRLIAREATRPNGTELNQTTQTALNAKQTAETALNTSLQAADQVDATLTAAKTALDTASRAETVANGKNVRRRAKTMPETPPGGWTSGDQWIVEDATGTPIAVKVWNGQEFVPDQILADSLLVASPDGAITLADGVVSASALAVGALNFREATGLNVSSGSFTGSSFSLSNVLSVSQVWGYEGDVVGVFGSAGSRRELVSNGSDKFLRVFEPGKGLIDVPLASSVPVTSSLVFTARFRVVADESVPASSPMAFLACKDKSGSNLLGTVSGTVPVVSGQWVTLSFAPEPGTLGLSVRSLRFAFFNAAYVDVDYVRLESVETADDGVSISRENGYAQVRVDDSLHECVISQGGITIGDKRGSLSRIHIGSQRIESGYSGLTFTGFETHIYSKRKLTLDSERLTVKGQNIFDTGWLPLTLSTGWAQVAGHTPRARVKNNVLYLEGALLRAAGGALNNLATLPAQIRDYFNVNRTVFLGGFTASHTNTTVAHGQLYISTGTGTLSCQGYNSLSPLAGWVIPISNSIPTDL